MSKIAQRKHGSVGSILAHGSQVVQVFIEEFVKLEDTGNVDVLIGSVLAHIAVCAPDDPFDTELAQVAGVTGTMFKTGSGPLSDFQ